MLTLIGADGKSLVEIIAIEKFKGAVARSVGESRRRAMIAPPRHARRVSGRRFAVPRTSVAARQRELLWLSLGITRRAEREFRAASLTAKDVDGRRGGLRNARQVAALTVGTALFELEIVACTHYHTSMRSCHVLANANTGKNCNDRTDG